MTHTVRHDAEGELARARRNCRDALTTINARRDARDLSKEQFRELHAAILQYYYSSGAAPSEQVPS
jgi:hypothetical protein